MAAHPLRLDLLDLLEAFAFRAVRSPTEAALLLGAPLGHVRHHVRVLEAAGYLQSPVDAPTEDPVGYRPTARARDLVAALSALA